MIGTRASALDMAVDAVTTADVASPIRAVLVSGPRGSGKSELFDHVVRVCREKGLPTMAVRASGDGAPLPYGVVLEAVADARASLPSRSEARVAADRLHTVELHQLAPAAQVVFAKVVEAFPQPAVLAVDDLFAADDESLTLLVQLLRRRGGPALTIVATRCLPDAAPRPAVRTLLDHLEQHAELVTLDLRALTDDEIRSAASGVLGAAVSDPLVEGLQHATAGNGFLVDQVAVGWRETGALELADDGWHLAETSPRLPMERCQRIVDRTLGSDETSRIVASAASLLGPVRVHRLGLFEAMTGLDETSIATALDTLVARGLLVDGGDRGYRFGHPALREALRACIGPGERWRLTQVAVRWLSARTQSPDVVLELADLVIDVAEHGDEREIATLVHAADLARDADPSSAIRWYRAALDLMPNDHLDRPLVLSRLSRALFVAGRLSGSLEVGRVALADLPPGADQRRSRRLVVEAIIADAMESVSDEGIEFLRVACRESPDDLRLLAASAHLLARAGRVAEATDAMAPIEALPDTTDGDDWIIARIHLARADSLLARYDEMLRGIESTVERLDGASFQSQLVALGYFSYILAEHGNPAATPLIDRAAGLQERSHWDLWQTELELARILDEFRAGHWDAALDRIAGVAHRFAASGSYSRLSIARAVEVEILANRGEWHAARRLDCDRLPSRTFEELRAWATAGVDLLSGDPSAALARLESSLAHATMPRWRHLLRARIAQTHLDRGDAAAAAAAASEVVGLGPPSQASLHDLDAWRAYGAATGDLDVLRQLHEEAERRAAPLLLGTVLLELGNQDVDTEANLREAYELFHGLGADPWRRRVATRLRSLGLKVPRHRQQAPVTLTDAELQVARLVQQGSRNRDIASALCMSVKTVESYLTRIYGKTGCSSRLELARRLDATAGSGGG